MERRSSTRRSSPPSTPKKNAYQDLLQSFGSRNSAASVTQQRRVSAHSTPNGISDSAETNKRATRQLTARSDAPTETTTSTSQQNSALPSPHKPPAHKSSMRKPSSTDTESEAPFLSPQKPMRPATDTSEDELSLSPEKKPVKKKAPRRSYTATTIEGLKMDPSHRKSDRPRRSLRHRASNILQSDTLADELAATPPKRKAPPRIKPDTARQRLRDDLAAVSKAKRNNFLVAHQDHFLPLLPSHNYISKLAPKAPIVEYEELTEQPKGVKATMKPYQLSGLSFLVYLNNNGFSGILGDEMGLGKTLQTLSLFQYLEERDKKTGVRSEEARPYLVVCPLSVLNSWVNEANKWVPNLKVLRFHGTSKERARLKKVVMGMEDVYGNETIHARDRKASRKAGVAVSKLPTEQGDQSYKIVVTTYEAFQAEQAWFKHSFIWRYIVLDEGHKIKNSMSDISKALKSVSAEYRLILTGTPLQNNLTEMWALLAWLYPDVFTENTATLFKESFNLTRGKVNKQTMDDARRLLELIMLRRMKDSQGVNLNLPPKEEVLLYVPLTPMQRFWYTRLLTRVGDSILDDLFSNVQDKEKEALKKDKQEAQLYAKVEQLEKKAEAGDKASWEETTDIMRQALQNEKSDTATGMAWRKLMNLVVQLRKCCSHPYLLPGASPDPYYLGDHVIRASGKFILLEKLLKHTIYNQGKKMLIFSGFTQTLDCCEDLLTLIGDYGRRFKYLRLDGSTVRARRNLDIRMFNSHDDYKVMLLSTRAGGLGINLTAAEDVIFLDEDWNPQITLQAEARAHRIGQTKPVTIYKLCTQGTVEEQMMGRIRKKLYLSTKITESMRNIHSEGVKSTSGQTSATEDMPQMDTTQLKSLVRRGAQTLSHPDINVTEMLSWDLDTMLQKCRDKPADPQANPDATPSEIDEEKWLSAMERVECAVFDGKRYQRQLETVDANAANILPDSISREDRRKDKNVTVMVDGFAISKESLNCADWEAVPTLAGKDDRLKDIKREGRREFKHEGHCLACFEPGDLVKCKGCPRSYHMQCLEPEFQAKIHALGGFHCAQHECVDCSKKTTDAGGLIYRCRWCENGFCEDCLDWSKTELIGENLPEFEMLGEGPTATAFYIKCPSCKDSMDEDEDRKEWILETEGSYKEQHQEWLQQRDKEVRELVAQRELEEQQKLEKEQEAAGLQRNIEDFDAPSPPALTDTSLPTPAAGGSGVSTPNILPTTIKNGVSPAKRSLSREEYFHESPEKRARFDQQPWNTDDDPLPRGFDTDNNSIEMPYINGKNKSNGVSSRH